MNGPETHELFDSEGKKVAECTIGVSQGISVYIPPEPTCKGCPEYEKGWCSLYGAIINFSNPVSACLRQKGTK